MADSFKTEELDVFTKAPTFYAVGGVLKNVKNIESEVKQRIGE